MYLHTTPGEVPITELPGTPQLSPSPPALGPDDTELTHQESDEDITVLDTGKHVPKHGEENYSPNDTTIPSEEPGGVNTDPPGLMTPLTHPHDTDLNKAPIVGPPNSKECTITTEILQITQQEALVRPRPKPPDNL